MTSCTLGGDAKSEDEASVVDGTMGECSHEEDDGVDEGGAS